MFGIKFLDKMKCMLLFYLSVHLLHILEKNKGTGMLCDLVTEEFKRPYQSEHMSESLCSVIIVLFSCMCSLH
jgi:hypothetical protein